MNICKCLTCKQQLVPMSLQPVDGIHDEVVSQVEC